MTNLVADMKAAKRLIDIDEGNVMLDGWFTPEDLRALLSLLTQSEPDARLDIRNRCMNCEDYRKRAFNFCGHCGLDFTENREAKP